MGKFGIVGDAIGAVEDAVGSAKEFSDDFTSAALFAVVQNPIDNFTHIFNRVSPVDLPHVQIFAKPDDNNSVGTKAGTVAGRTFSNVLAAVLLEPRARDSKLLAPPPGKPKRVSMMPPRIRAWTKSHGHFC